MKIKTDFVSRRARQLKQEGLRDLGEAVAEARRAAELTRYQLSERIGMNPDKGASKLAMLELGRGDYIPVNVTVRALAEVLGIEGTRLETHLYLATEFARRLDDEEVLRRRAARTVALCHHEDVFTKNLRRLYEHADQILDTPEWSNARVLTSGCSIAYFGGEVWSLSTVLACWRRGDLYLSCPECGSEFYVYFAGGSPLSGRNSLLGYCVECETTRTTTVPEEIGLTRFVAPAREFQRQLDEAVGQTVASLEQVVQALGGDVPDVVIRDADENHVATWSPVTSTINSADGTMLLAQVNRGDPRAASSSGRWSRRCEPVRQGGRLRIGDLRTLAGPWRGNVLVIHDDAGRVYEVHPGYVQHGMDVVAWIESPVPIEVAAWVIENLG